MKKYIQQYDKAILDDLIDIILTYLEYKDAFYLQLVDSNGDGQRLGWYIQVQLPKRKTNRTVAIPYDMRKAKGPIVDACHNIEDCSLFIWEPLHKRNNTSGV